MAERHRATVLTDAEAASLVVVCGLPGVGKSTVARRVADRIDADVLRTDVVRKELFEEPEYTTAESEAVYDELLVRADDRLTDDESVVLDATFKSRSRRVEVRELTDRVDCGFRLVYVDCEASVVERRIAERDGVSDADFEVHQAFRERFEPVRMDHLAVDNSGSEAETDRQVAEAFERDRGATTTNLD